MATSKRRRGVLDGTHRVNLPSPEEVAATPSSCAKCKLPDFPCHPCPDMRGEVMPGCMGTAVSGPQGCTCEGTSEEEVDHLQVGFSELLARVNELEAAVADLEETVGELSKRMAR